MDLKDKDDFLGINTKIVSLLAQHLDLREYREHWITEIEFEDLLQKDSLLVYEHCGLATLLSLWENLPSLHLYMAETTYFEIKRRYVRRNFSNGVESNNAKALAAKLNVSQDFIYEALLTDKTAGKAKKRGK